MKNSLVLFLVLMSMCITRPVSAQSAEAPAGSGGMHLYAGQSFGLSRSGGRNRLQVHNLQIGLEWGVDRKIGHRLSVFLPAVHGRHYAMGEFNRDALGPRQLEHAIYTEAAYQVVWNPLAGSESRLQPYFAAGLHAAYGRLRYVSPAQTGPEVSQHFALGLSLEAGLRYKLNDTWTLTAALRWGVPIGAYDTQSGEFLSASSLGKSISAMNGNFPTTGFSLGFAIPIFTQKPKKFR